ncbi:hypothetical protein SO802_001387 [Lithocarpus litseifolius]|uniref:Uncharacterized protein n=1 Tax=Lithocarpus litseifolius TaxID=425828 RepID=A0AAW2DXN8_9ROSI
MGLLLMGCPVRLLHFSGKWVLEGVQPNGFTMVSLLSACAELGALALGRRAHVYMLKIGSSVNLHVNNALLDLYAKKYKRLHVLEFGSSRKRMPVIVRNAENQSFLLCKGTDRYACSLLREDMKQIVITLDSPDIDALERKGIKRPLQRLLLKA